MVKVSHLTKRFGGRHAVEDLTFTLSKGQITALLGENGAGKTTTMKMLSGILCPDEGTISICGHDMKQEPSQAVRCIGYAPEQPPLYPELTVRECLHFKAGLYGASGAEAKRKAEELIGLCGLSDFADRLAGQLSKGMQQRAGMAMALVTDPSVLLLDEPTAGLDPRQSAAFRELLKSLAPEKAVLLSTHILSEVHAVCDKVLILDRGHLAAETEPGEDLEKLFLSLTDKEETEEERAPEAGEESGREAEL